MSRWEESCRAGSAKISLAALVLVLGCSSGELEKTQGELKVCGDQRSSLAIERDSCRNENTRLTQRLNNLQVTLAEPVPPSVKEAQEVFLKRVPDEVRVELELYLDSYFATVDRQFKELQQRHREILHEMKRGSREISQEISKASDQVEKVVDSASKVEQGLAEVQKGAEETQQLRQRQQKTAAELQQIVASLVEFDRTRLNCKECKVKLKMMGKNREAILKFHSSLIQSLTALQASAETPAPHHPSP